MDEFLSRHVMGENTVEDLLWAGGILLFGIIFQLLFTRVIARFVYGFLKNHSHGVPFEKLFELVKGPLGRFILFISVYFAFLQLTAPAGWKMCSPDQFGLRMIAE